MDTAMNNSLNRAKSAIEQHQSRGPDDLGTSSLKSAHLGRGGISTDCERTDRFLRTWLALAAIKNRSWRTILDRTNKTAVLIDGKFGRVFNLQHARWKF